MGAGSGDARRPQRIEAVDAVVRLGEVANRVVDGAEHLLSEDQLRQLEQQANLGLRVREYEHALALSAAHEARKLELEALRDEHEYERQGRNDAHDLAERKRRDDAERARLKGLHRAELAKRWLGVAGRAVLVAGGIVTVYYWAVTGEGPIGVLTSFLSHAEDVGHIGSGRLA